MDSTNSSEKYGRLSLSTIPLAVTVFLISQSVYADDIMGGLKKVSSYVRTGSIIISTIAVIAAGLVMTFNKERGFEKMSGAVIGLGCIAGASAIVAAIQSFFG